MFYVEELYNHFSMAVSMLHVPRSCVSGATSSLRSVDWAQRGKKFPRGGRVPKSVAKSEEKVGQEVDYVRHSTPSDPFVSSLH